VTPTVLRLLRGAADGKYRERCYCVGKSRQASDTNPLCNCHAFSRLYSPWAIWSGARVWIGFPISHNTVPMSIVVCDGSERRFCEAAGARLKCFSSLMHGTAICMLAILAKSIVYRRCRPLRRQQR
jgi:hypothetical protein